MRIETLSIKTATVVIFVMIGCVASILSLWAGSYFRQAALDAQIGSLSRVIEVASQEMLKIRVSFVNNIFCQVAGVPF